MNSCYVHKGQLAANSTAADGLTTVVKTLGVDLKPSITSGIDTNETMIIFPPPPVELIVWDS